MNKKEKTQGSCWLSWVVHRSKYYNSYTMTYSNKKEKRRNFNCAIFEIDFFTNLLQIKHVDKCNLSDNKDRRIFYHAFFIFIFTAAKQRSFC